jgi:hypothetical protein
LKLSLLKKVLISGIVAATILAGTLIAAGPAAADVESMTVTPASQNVANGATTISVSINANSTAQVFGWGANLIFPKADLQVVSITYGGFMASSFGTVIAAPNSSVASSNAAGVISNLGQTFLGATSGPTGTGTLVTVVFSAVTPAGDNMIDNITLDPAINGTQPASNLNTIDANGHVVMLPTTLNNGTVTVGTVQVPDLTPINVAANGTNANYTVSFNVQNLGGAASPAATTANIFVDGATTPATTVTVPVIAAHSTSGPLTSSSLTISGTLDSIVVTVVPVTGETNTSNNSSAPVNYIYQAPPSGNPVIVDGNIGLTFNFTPPSAISFGTMHVGNNVQTDTNMNVTSNEAWQITVQGLAPTSTGGTDGKMTKWLPPVAPATVGTYYPAVKLHAPLQIGANTPTSSGTFYLDGTVQTLGSGTPETQHTDGIGLTMSTTFTQNMSYTDYALTNGYNYHIVVNFICTPTLY